MKAFSLLMLIFALLGMIFLIVAGQPTAAALHFVALPQ